MIMFVAFKEAQYYMKVSYKKSVIYNRIKGHNSKKVAELTV